MASLTDMQNPDKRPSAKKHFVLMALLVVVVVSIAMYANTWKETRLVSEVVVEGNRIIPDKDILASAKVPNGTPLFALDLFAIEQRVAKNQFVKSVAVHRDIPHRVRISIEERIPVAAMVLDKVYYLDADGYVLPPARSQFIFDLPVLSGSLSHSELLPGQQTSSKNVLEALSLLAIAREVDEEMYRNISEIRIDGNKDLMFYTAELGVPVIVGRGNFGTKMVTFDSFWREVVARNGAYELQYIDLRYDEQVVVRWSREHGDVHS